jgi:hypothetical protein
LIGPGAVKVSARVSISYTVAGHKEIP